MLQTVSRTGSRMWMAAGEAAPRRAGAALRYRLLAETAVRLAPLLISAAVPCALTGSPAQANPKGGQVVAGSATIASPSSTQLQVTQTTNRAAIDWQSFDIAPGERTSFVQPSAAAWTLNRVKAADPSVIAGRLTSNGSLVLINPNGIVFSKGSQVDVHSLIATPSDISNANFMAGSMKFDKPPSNPAATVVNNGTITVAQHGLAALVAPGVANSGLIEAKLAKVVLAGAETFAVDFYGDGLISFDVGSQVKTVPIGPDGKPMTSLVSNTGRIDAPGGTVLLTADAAAGILENVVDVPGTITARSAGQTPGSVTVDAGPTGTANLAGRIDVSGLKPGQVGGTATVTGNAVNLARTARIRARGDAAGGTVRIGGGPHGQDPTVRNAQMTNVAAGAIIDASATGNGDGGKVAVWSDQTTQFAGTIRARGGPNGGDGGWVETSGHQLGVASEARVDALAPNGKVGNWVLDPASITVQAGGPGTLAQAADASDTSTALVIDPSSINSAAANVSFQASDFVAFNSPISIAATGVHLIVNAGSGGITINAPIAANEPMPGQFGIQLMSVGQIMETPTGTIQVRQLRAVTFNDPGSDIKLDNHGNHVVSVTLNSLDSTQSSLASGNITFVNDNQLQLDFFRGLELGISTKGDVTLGNFILDPSKTTGGVFQNLGPGAINNRIIANNLVVDTTLNANSPSQSPDKIILANPTNAVTGTVTLRTFQGDIAFFNTSPPNTALTVAGVSTLGTATLQEAGGALKQSGPIIAQNLVARTQSGAGGDIILTGPGNAVSGNVTLTSLGAQGTALGSGSMGFTDTIGFSVAKSQPLDLMTGLGGVVIPAGGNSGLELGANTSGGISLTSSGSLTISGSVDAVGQAVVFLNAGAGGISINGPIASAQNASVYGIDLVSQGPITETGAGSITVPALRALTESNVPASIKLTNPANSVPVNVTLTALNAAGNALGSGDIGFANSTGVAVVAVSGGGQGGLELGANTTGNINLSANGSLTIDNPVKGGAVTLSSTGPISEQLLGSIAAANLVVRTQNDLGAAITLQNAGNSVPGNVTLSALNTAGTAPAAGAILFVDSTGFTVAAQPGNGVGGQEIGVSTNSSVMLMAGGPLLETGSISAAALTGSSVGGATLTNANQLTDLGVFTNTGGGGFALTNAAPLTVNGTVTTGSGGITLNTGARLLTVSSPLLSTGTISLTADTMSLGAQIGGSGAATGQATQVNLAPSTAGRAISLGAGAATGLALTDTELNEIRSTDVAIGSAAAGALTFDGAFTASAAFGTDTATNGFSLTTGSSAEVSSAFTLQGGFSINAGTTISLNSSITTPGAQSYTDTVLDLNGTTYKTTNGALTETGKTVLTDDAMVDTSAGNQNIVFHNPGTIDGAFGLTLRSGSGAITVAGAVGGTTALTSLTASGGTNMLDGSVRTTGGQSYTDTVLDLNGSAYTTVSGAFTANGKTVLTSGVTVDTSAGNQNIVFQTPGTIDGGFGLTLKSGSGAITVGGSAALTSLTATGGTIALGGSVTTTGPQTLTQTGSGVILSLTHNLTTPQTLTLTSAGTIDQTGGLIGAGTLTGNSVGGASLTRSNLVGTFGPFSNTAGGLLSFTNGQSLTTSGAVTSAGNLTLTTTGAGSNLTLGGSLSGQMVTLSSSGIINESSGAITATTLTGSSTGTASLAQPGNMVTNLGAFSTGNGDFALTDGQALNLNGPLNAGTGVVMLTSAGTIAEQSGGSVTAATLTGSSSGSASLAQPGNMVTNLGAFSTGNGDFVLTDGQALNLSGALNAGTGVVMLTSAGTITEQSGGTITAATLTGSSSGTASLAQPGNMVTNLSRFLTGNGDFTLTDGQALNLSGALNAGTGVVMLTSTGTITEQPGGVITATTLTGSSSGSASLAQPGNMVTNLGAFSTGNGDFALTDGQALNLTGRLNAGTGSVALSSTSTIGEQPGSVITAAGLIADAGGAVNLDTVENAVGVLSGKAGTGSFRFLNANPLTIGALGPVLGMTQSGVMAGQDIVIQTNSTAQGTAAASALNISADMSAGGNLLVTSRGSLTVSGTLDLAAGKNIVLDSNGPFVQSGVLKVSADPPPLVVDTTDTAGTGAQALLNTLLSSPSNGGSDTITTPKVVNALPPSTLGPPSNPISFADLEAGGSIVVLIGNSGVISGTINVGQLGISGNGASAQLVGSIGGNSGPLAAQFAVLAGGINGQYLFNACPIGGAGCGVLTPNNLDILTARAEVIESIISAASQQSQTQVDILLSRPREFDRFTGRPQDEDIDASIINIFDEERLCEEMRLKSPEAAREVCR